MISTASVHVAYELGMFAPVETSDKPVDKHARQRMNVTGSSDRRSCRRVRSEQQLITRRDREAAESIQPQTLQYCASGNVAHVFFDFQQHVRFRHACEHA